MFVARAVVVVQVKLGDARAQKLEGVVETGVAQVGVAYVEGDAYVGEVTHVEDLKDVLGCGDIVLQIFDEDFDSERVSEGLEVFDGGEGVVDGRGVPGIVFEAEMEGDGGDGDLLGGLKGSLDLVHGVDAVGLVGGDEGEGCGDVARPALRLFGREDGLVHGGAEAGVAEPVGDLANGWAVGVVEVMAGCEELDGLCSAALEGVEQAGVEALREEDVGGDSGLHDCQSYINEGCGDFRFTVLGIRMGAEFCEGFDATDLSGVDVDWNDVGANGSCEHSSSTNACGCAGSGAD